MADGGGNTATAVGTDVTGSSECFAQALGGSGVGVGGWLVALAALGVGRRPQTPATH